MSIEHVVVLMLENRSFDNVLGGLYAPGNAAPYDRPPPGQAALGGIPAGAANPGPNGPVPAHNQTTPTSLGGTGPTYAATAIPLVDPGEYFADIAMQIIPLDAVPTSPVLPPWDGYSPTSPHVAQGYVNNYAQLGGMHNLMFASQKRPPPQNYGDVMNFFNPAQLPVTAFLANRYGLSDNWFASVPSQTYVNRSFALSAAPAVANGASFIDDLQYFHLDLLHPGNPRLVTIDERDTIFSQLDQVLSRTGSEGPFWKVYFHDYSITFDTLRYVQMAAAATPNVNVGTFDDADWGGQQPTQLPGPAASSFVHDLRHGRLPRFSWIEPRYFDNWAPAGLPPNSNHPGSAAKLFNEGSKAPIDAATGEVLLMNLYNLLRESPAWEKTLLIVTYDESCGLWDQAPPPFAAEPGGVPAPDFDKDPAATGFAYNVLGGRVPALVVSPRVVPGSLFREDRAFDHTSIIKTVRDVFLAPHGFTTPLTGRDAAAPSLLPGLAEEPVNSTGVFQGTIVAGPGSLYFEHMKLMPYPAPQTVLASAGSGFPLQVSVSQPSGEPWLSATAGADSPTTITVAADPEHLQPGSYTGSIEISSTAPGVVPLSIPVRLDVLL